MDTIVLHLKTTHDSNGNPRRLFLPLNADRLGTVTNVIEEGYAGTAILRSAGISGYVLVPIHVPVSEYKDWIRWAKDLDCYIE